MRHREVDIFNFSFLDILACVIGLLIFVLTIVVVSGGRSNSRQSDGRLSNAEHQLAQSQTSAQMAAEQRRRTEQLLAQQAKELSDPQGTVQLVKGQIRMLNEQRINLESATANSSAKRDSLQQAMRQVGEAKYADPAAIEVQNELRRLDEETADLGNRAVELQRKLQADPRHVQFYVPHLRESNRSVTRWVEVAGDRFWCIGSDDYLSLPIGDASTLFTRVQGKPGTSISALARGQIAPPPFLLLARPDDAVLEVALHPDGYEAFRLLRQWAWSKGYSVNWEPQDVDSIVLTHSQHIFEQ